AYADFDKDGDLDVLLTENHGPAHLWRNDLIGPDRPSSGWVKIRLQGTESNRDAIGARLVGKAAQRVMDRRVRTGSSYLSQSEKAVVFGVGETERLDSLRVYWPSGRIDHFADVPAGQEILIIEGEGTLRIPAEEGSLSTQLTRRSGSSELLAHSHQEFVMSCLPSSHVFNRTGVCLLLAVVLFGAFGCGRNPEDQLTITERKRAAIGPRAAAFMLDAQRAYEMGSYIAALAFTDS